MALFRRGDGCSRWEERGKNVDWCFGKIWNCIRFEIFLLWLFFYWILPCAGGENCRLRTYRYIVILFRDIFPPWRLVIISLGRWGNFTSQHWKAIEWVESLGFYGADIARDMEFGFPYILLTTLLLFPLCREFRNKGRPAETHWEKTQLAVGRMNSKKNGFPNVEAAKISAAHELINVFPNEKQQFFNLASRRQKCKSKLCTCKNGARHDVSSPASYVQHVHKSARLPFSTARGYAIL